MLDGCKFTIENKGGPVSDLNIYESQNVWFKKFTWLKLRPLNAVNKKNHDVPTFRLPGSTKYQSKTQNEIILIS